MSRGMSAARAASTDSARGWRPLLERWLNRRLPPRRSVTLDHSKLFILPTRAGLAFLLVICLLWLLGTNYQNNLVYALAFLLVGLFAVLPVHTFANLSGARLRLLEVRPGFAGDYGEALIAVDARGRRQREQLRIFWPGEEGATLDLENGEQQARIALPLPRRGRLRAPRIRIESRYPLGLFRCWSWVDLDVEFLVYPQPKPAGPLPLGAATGEGDSPLKVRGLEDFAGLKLFQPGHSLRHVAWKQYAGGRDLYSKEYERGTDSRLWLEWDLLAGRDLETRLGNLCDWALAAEREQLAYGLRLPHIGVDPGLGSAHLAQVLKALALFPVQEV